MSAFALKTKYNTIGELPFPPPPRNIIESWDEQALKWFVQINTGDQYLASGAPGFILGGFKSNTPYIVVYYKNDRTGEIFRAKIVDVDEGQEIYDRYHMRLEVKNGVHN